VRTPEDALGVSDQQATDELFALASRQHAEVRSYAGHWVPQVSGKCVGLTADLGPDWFPDGVDDSSDITAQQILAFHLSMDQRFRALLVEPVTMGIASNEATTGPCQARRVWMSIVPRAFDSGEAANAWCDINVPPVRECLARYVARGSETSKSMVRP
jgi:hypothetical protein